MSVGTNALPLAGIVISFALYRSCPALYGLPFVGAFACSLRRRTWSCCSAMAAAAMEGAIGAGACREAMFAMLARGVGVDVPASSPRGSVETLESGVGSITFVRFGRGEEGREGGSWVGWGVDMSSLVDCWKVR